GTVLGGLWADDSWGRFWGWDPKENGAMMIVLWNALLLHARWDRQVAERGFALLAIGGNIITTWSYFGTNQLGIGLHAYGGADVGADETAPTLWTDPLGALRENGSLYGTFGFIFLNFLLIVVAFMLTRSMKTTKDESEKLGVS
ncbi:MAG: cytochrome c biogenesis protein CcsA, partial [Planctomycetota bacterium]